MNYEQGSKIYAVIDFWYHHGIDLQKIISQLCDYGVEWFQFRDDRNNDEDYMEWTHPYRKIIKELGRQIIINNRVHLVESMDADGVHLGQQDMDIFQARENLGIDKIIGMSTHTIDEVHKANHEPLDYLAFGPIFKTPIKPHLSEKGLDSLKEVINLSRFPVVAIGGIELENMDEVLACGVQKVAMIHGIKKIYHQNHS